METLLQLRPIGNSQGLVLPKALLRKVGAGEGAAFTAQVDGGKLVLTRAKPVREGWRDAAVALAAAGEDSLVLGDFDNQGDEVDTW